MDESSGVFVEWVKEGVFGMWDGNGLYEVIELVV